jgi:hypothetical protein
MGDAIYQMGELMCNSVLDRIGVVDHDDQVQINRVGPITSCPGTRSLLGEHDVGALECETDMLVPLISSNNDSGDFCLDSFLDFGGGCHTGGSVYLISGELSPL